MNDITITLTKEEVDLILSGLVQLPYIKVMTLVQKVISQAQPEA